MGSSEIWRPQTETRMRLEEEGGKSPANQIHKQSKPTDKTITNRTDNGERCQRGD